MITWNSSPQRELTTNPLSGKLEADHIPVPDRSWKLSDWLDYWLDNIVAANRRPATYSLYEATVRLYLKPALGTASLTKTEIMRCLKRYIAREVFPHLLTAAPGAVPGQLQLGQTG